MTNQTLGILLGGLLPAICFALSNLFTKPANATGIGTGAYLVAIGLAVTLVGVALYCWQPRAALPARGIALAAGVGFAWAVGTAGIAWALAQYGATLARLVPLFNMNTLLTVLVSLVIYSEWREVEVGKLLAGAVLIVLGGTLVATA